MAATVQISDSDSDEEVRSVPARPPPKRRRAISPSSVAAVSLYKVNLQFKPASFTQEAAVGQNLRSAGRGAAAGPEPPPANKRPIMILTDSEEEEEEELDQDTPLLELHSPSPPPPLGSPAVRMSRRARKHLERNRRALDVAASPSPEAQQVTASQESLVLDDAYADDDIILMSPSKMTRRSRAGRRPPAGEERRPPAREEWEDSPPAARKLTLKFRSTTDLHKITLLSTAPLSKAVEQLSIKLNVPPSRILLLNKDQELPVQESAQQLGLGIADIIDCVIIGPDQTTDPEDGSDIITLRLQGREAGSGQEYTLHKDAPLGSILSQYLSGLPRGDKRKTRFRFDGSNVGHNQTPSELDMEDGDVIEAWT